MPVLHNARMFLTLPTILTWARIVAIPLIVGVFYLPLGDATRNWVATVMFVVFAATDWLDGYLARKLNQTSAFGAFLDPVADKILVCAALLVLVKLDRVDVLVALVIIGREIAISSLREWMAQIGASPSMCTATLLVAPISAIHSRKAEIAISRPMMMSATNTSARCRCTSTSKDAQTKNLSATGSKKAPNDEVWLSLRAR